MFPDSSITKSFTIGYDKASYLLSFGITPYCVSKLLGEQGESKSFCISFDEFLNKDLQEIKWIVRVRYLDPKEDMVANVTSLLSEGLYFLHFSDLKDNSASN